MPVLTAIADVPVAGLGHGPSMSGALGSEGALHLIADVGLRVNEACKLDLADVKWDLGRFGKLHVRHVLTTGQCPALAGPPPLERWRADRWSRHRPRKPACSSA